MKAHESHLTAEEAKEMLLNKLAESETINNFMLQLKEAITYGRNHFNYHVRSSEYDFTEQEIEYLETLGYDLRWNGACLWYEVTFPIR